VKEEIGRTAYNQNPSFSKVGTGCAKNEKNLKIQSQTTKTLVLTRRNINPMKRSTQELQDRSLHIALSNPATQSNEISMKFQSGKQYTIERSFESKESI
jgi:hypothetical protein